MSGSDHPVVGRIAPPKPPRIDTRREPESERRSADSFGPLNDDDRALLQNVLKTSQAALKKSEERATELEGKFAIFRGETNERFTEIEAQVAELRGIGGDIRGLRGDISTLNTSVLNNLAMDAQRDERTRALENKMAGIAIDEGRAAGKSAGARWGALTGLSPAALGILIWIIAALIAAFQGRPPPALPGTAPTPPAQSSPPPAK